MAAGCHGLFDLALRRTDQGFGLKEFLARRDVVVFPRDQTQRHPSTPR